MKPHRNLHFSLLLPAFLASLLLCAAGADAASAQYKFSDPAKPGTVRIRIGRGNLVVRAGDGPEITIQSNSAPKQSPVRPDGLRVLTESTGYWFTEDKNVATLDYGIENPGESGDFQITVPRNTSIIVNDLWGGDVTCSGISGDLDIRSRNGKVSLDDVSGGALVEATNGEIRAAIREIHEGRPLSFTSVNGAVSIRLPADAKANVRLRTQNGTILTDFDEKALITKTEMAPARGKRLKQASSGDAGAVSGDKLDDVIQQSQQAVREEKEAIRETAQAVHETNQAIQEAAQASREAMGESGVFAPVPPIPPLLPPIPPLPPMTGGKIVSGTLNGGGPEIQAMTVNGDVILRKSLDKKQ
ncbi:MAG: DUF4097 family beta strand repeat-containing protein [Opitutaceae bacterium]|jgi:hypothetical protein